MYSEGSLLISYSTVIKRQGTHFIEELKTVLARGMEKVKGMRMLFPTTLAKLGTRDS